MTEAYQVAKEEEEEREEELASPAAAKEREDSLRAYAGFDPAEAEELLVKSFPEFLASLNSDPVRSLSDSRLDRNLGEGDAVVTTEGKTQLMEGSFPVEARNDEGSLEKVDVTLEATAEGYEAENPLVEVAIADSVEDGIVVGGEGSAGDLPPITIAQVGAEESAARRLGDKNVFYGEVEPGADTDLFVAPTTYGVEIASLLRTVDSPETLRFHVDLPAGAVLRAAQGGGAEVLAADGELLYLVDRPVSFDAQGATVPTALEVEGDNLVVRVLHREADVAYPILVDPELQMDWNHPSFPGIAPNGPWYPSESWANNGMYVGTSDGYWPGLQGLYFHAHNATIAAGAWDQLTYYPPNEQSYIARAFLHQFHRGDSCSPLVQDPYDYTGMYAWNNGGTPETPHWNGYRNNDAYWQGWANINSWGNALVIGYGNASTKVNACWRRVRVGLMTIWLQDWQYPYLNSVGATPSGWTKKDSTPRSFAVSASDAGLGVRTVRMFGVGTQQWQWSNGWCAGTYANPCNTSGSGQITFTTDGFPYEGRYNGEGKERKFTVQVEDPTEKTWALERTLWLDGTAPGVSLSGQLATITKQVGETENPQNEAGDDDELSLPTYKLQIAADDGADRSGVKEIKVFLDKDPSKEPGAVPTATQSAGSCPTAGCAQTLNMDYTLRLPGLDAGKHSLWIVAVDKVGNESPPDRNIEFEYFPATGMKDAYVLQHIRLPDGEDHAEEEPYRGPEIAVNVINGNLVYHERDLAVQTEEAGLELERLYNSQAPAEEDGQWGHGWTIAQAPELDAEEGPSPQKATMVQSGEITPGVDLPASLGEETFDPDLQATIEKRAGGGYEVTDEADDGVAVFDDSGRIEEEPLAEVPDEAPPPPGPEELEEPTFADSYGTTGTAAGEFDEISDAAADGAGDLWVVDRGNDRVQKLGPRGAVLAQFGGSGSANGQFDSPAAIAIDPEGDLWVLDGGNSRVQQFSPAGAFISKFGTEGSGSGQLDAAEGIAVSPSGHVWVADTGNSRLQEFNQAGVPLQVVGTKTPGPGNLGEPTGVDVDFEGDVWVADWEKNRIVVFDSEGDFIDQFGSVGTGAGKFRHPRSIAVDDDAEGWVSDEGNARVQHFNSNGEFVEAFGARGNAAGRFSHPTGIAIDDHGSLWVGDTGEARVSPGEAATSLAPVVSYSFDENVGKFAHDASGDHDAAIEGAEWTEAGRFGGALEFDAGEEDLLTVADSDDLRLEDFTIEAWVKSTETRNSAPIVSKVNIGDYGYALYAGDEEHPGIPEGYIMNQYWVDAYAYDGDPLQLGEWTHVALTSDGDALKIYVDGVLKDEAEAEEVRAGGGPLQIGGNTLFEEDEYFDGLIDEVRVYGRSLGQAEIEADMEAAVGRGAKPHPVAALSFDEGEGELARDSARNHDGRLHDATWTEGGKYGAGIHFDGSYDWVAVPDSDQLDFSETFTFEAWVRPEEHHDWSTVLAKGEPNEEDGYSYILYASDHPEDPPKGWISDGETEEDVEGDEVLPLDAWSHLAMTSDGEKMRLYVDGELVDTAAAPIARDTDAQVLIGGNVTWWEFFEGTIDEVRLYDDVLDAGEIEEDMETAIGLAPRAEPVAALSFDEGAGDVARDSAGINDGRLDGATWTEDGKYGAAVSFDGIDDLVTVADSDGLDLTESFTLEAWIRPDEVDEWGAILTKERGGSLSYQLHAQGYGEGPFGIVSDGEGYADVSGPEELPDGEWTHLVLSSDGETLRLYVNGELEASADGVVAAPGGGDLQIGGNLVWGEEDAFRGEIDEARLYDRVLSVAEIEADMEEPIDPAPRPTPIAAYSFDQGEGTVAHDDSEHGHFGRIDGAEWSAEGKFGSALKFGGSDEECVTIPDVADLRLTDDFTLESWVYLEGSDDSEPVIFKESDWFFSYTLYVGLQEEHGYLPEGGIAEYPYDGEAAGGEEEVPIGTWVNLAMTYDRNLMRLYVDGELVDTAPTGPAVSSRDPLRIGCVPRWEDGFTGLIDEVRIYDRALSADELGEDMEAPVESSLATDRLQKWQTEVYSEEAIEWPEPPSVDYGYEGEDLVAMDLDEGEDPEAASIDIDLSGGLSEEASAGEEESVEYSYEAGMLTEADGPEGASEYEYDGGERLERVELANGTVATIGYDGTERVIAVTVDPAGEEGPQTTHFSYSTEPRRTIVWGGGEPEVTYDIGEDGSVLKWSWAESPPTIETISGSLWSQRNSTTPIENKDHTLFVTASSPHQIAQIQVLVDGRAVVEETTCEDPSEPPEHKCDQPPQLEWITHAAQHPPGRLNLEVVATDFFGRESSESFFVTIPQQPPEDPEAPPRPSFDQIKNFREEYGLDRERSYTQAEFNALILELLYEWESDYPAARAGVEGWGAPMRQAELSELEFREQYVEQAAELIPEWAESNAPGTYGGYYVDHRAGGVIHVGFTEGQADAVAAIRQIPGLLAPEAMVQGYPQQPTLSLAAISATEEAVADAVSANQSILDLVTKIHADEMGSRIRVGTTDVGTVSSFIVSQFGAGAPIDVVYDNDPAEGSFSRFPGLYGPVYAGQGLESQKFLDLDTRWCTSGFSARVSSNDKRQGKPPYLYFTLTAGHCFPKGEHVHRPLSRNNTSKQFPIGEVRRTKWLGPSEPHDDNWSVDAAAILLANPHNASKDMYVGDPNKLAAVRGAKPIREGMNVCRSGINGGVACGPVTDSYWSSYTGNTPPIGKKRLVPVFVVKAGAIGGDSGGPVWQRKSRGRAVALHSGHIDSGCKERKAGRWCPTTFVTPLRPSSGRVDHPGALNRLGLNLYHYE